MTKKIKFIFLLTFLLVLGLCTKAEARITTSDPKTKPGGTVTITINSQEPVASGGIKMTSNGGLTFISASSAIGHANGGFVAFSDSKNHTSGIATYTLKVPNVDKTTTYKVTFSSQDMADATGAEVASSSATATVTVEVEEPPKQDQTPTTPETPTTTTPKEEPKEENKEEKPAEPTFTSVNETVYAKSTVNVRESYSTNSTKLGSLNKGDEVTRIGKGSNGWSKITYNGKTAYVNSSYLTTEQPQLSNIKALKTLTITPGELTPEFDPEITQYEMTVDDNVLQLTIEAVPEEDTAKVEVIGNEELVEGENTVTIKVTAEDETVRNYIITVIKEKETPLGLLSFTTTKGTISPKFKLDTYVYEITLVEDLAELELDMEASDENASIEVIGNENLVNGSLIKVLVYFGDKDEEGTEIAEYSFTIKKNIAPIITQTEQEGEFLSRNHIIYIATIVLVTIAIIALFIARYFTTKEEDEDDNDFELKEEKAERNKEEKFEREQREETENRTESKPEKSELLDKFLQEEPEEEYRPKKRKGKGKHSL